MKLILIILILNVQFCVFALKPSSHLDQSLPFEQVLQAIRTDDPYLLRSAFDRKIQRKTADMEVWKKRLTEGKAYFFKRFGEYSTDDFTYEYFRSDKELIVYFKGGQVMEKKVKRQGGTYRLSN